jgi:hypothetical protein
MSHVVLIIPWTQRDNNSQMALQEETKLTLPPCVTFMITEYYAMKITTCLPVFIWQINIFACMYKFIYTLYCTSITYIHSIYSYMFRLIFSHHHGVILYGLQLHTTWVYKGWRTDDGRECQPKHVGVYKINVCNWCAVVGINKLIYICKTTARNIHNIKHNCI